MTLIKLVKDTLSSPQHRVLGICVPGLRRGNFNPETRFTMSKKNEDREVMSQKCQTVRVTMPNNVK